MLCVAKIGVCVAKMMCVVTTRTPSGSSLAIQDTKEPHPINAGSAQGILEPQADFDNKAARHNEPYRFSTSHPKPSQDQTFDLVEFTKLRSTKTKQISIEGGR